MYVTIVRVAQLAELLTVLGAGGTLVGGVVGWLIDAPTSRRAFENLALGATAGGVGGCLVAFFAYLGARIAGAKMPMMERITQLIGTLIGVSVLAFAAGVFLMRVDAGFGWYYAVGLLLTGLAVLRTLVPSAGLSGSRIKGLWRKDSAHMPHPTA